MEDMGEYYSLREMKPCSKLQREWLHKAVYAETYRDYYDNNRLWVQLLNKDHVSLTCIRSPSKECYGVQLIGGKWYWKLTDK